MVVFFRARFGARGFEKDCGYSEREIFPNGHTIFQNALTVSLKYE
jgi:hypothetical protein